MTMTMNMHRYLPSSLSKLLACLQSIDWANLVLLSSTVPPMIITKPYQTHMCLVAWTPCLLAGPATIAQAKQSKANPLLLLLHITQDKPRPMVPHQIVTTGPGWLARLTLSKLKAKPALGYPLACWYLSIRLACISLYTRPSSSSYNTHYIPYYNAKPPKQTPPWASCLVACWPCT